MLMLGNVNHTFLPSTAEYAEPQGRPLSCSVATDTNSPRRTEIKQGGKAGHIQLQKYTFKNKTITSCSRITPAE